MTIAIGFNCLDGIVFCADSLESDGMTKKVVDKIWMHQVGGRGWGIAVASAGEADLADSFTDQLPELLGDEDFDRVTVLSKLRGAIAQVRTSYPESQLAMLVGIYGIPMQQHPTPTCEILRNHDRSYHFGPVKQYEAIGLGAHLSTFLIKNLFHPSMFVDEAIKLGIFTIGIAKENVDGCGGPTRVVVHRRGGTYWTALMPTEIESIERSFAPETLQSMFREYWEKTTTGIKPSASETSALGQ